MAVVRRKMAAPSSMLHVENGRSGAIAQSTTTGAMIKLATASASHQLTQADVQADAQLAVHAAGFERLGSSARIDAATATVELTIAVGAKQMSANFAVPMGVWKVLRPFDQRSTSHTPISAADSTPIAVTPDVKKGRAASAPQASDPNKIAGQIR